MPRKMTVLAANQVAPTETATAMSRKEAQRALMAEPVPRTFLDTAGLQKEILPLSRRAIYDLRKQGVLPFVQNGSKVLFHRKSVEEALLRRQIGGGQ